jgi:hypothetical protein
MFQLAEQRMTQLYMGDKSERAQKVFALDYCASAFVTEGATAPSHNCLLHARIPFAHAQLPRGSARWSSFVGVQRRSWQDIWVARNSPCRLLAVLGFAKCLSLFRRCRLVSLHKFDRERACWLNQPGADEDCIERRACCERLQIREHVASDLLTAAASTKASSRGSYAKQCAS